MEAAPCHNATIEARLERDGCSRAMSNRTILYAFLGKRCKAHNVETQAPEQAGTDNSESSKGGAEKLGADFLVSQTKGGRSASIIGTQNRKPGEGSDLSSAIEHCSSKKSKRITKGKAGRLLLDKPSLVEAGGKLKARIGFTVVTSRVAAVEEKDADFQKGFTQASANTTLPDSVVELHSSKGVFDELAAKGRTAGSSRQNSKEIRKRHNFSLAAHSAGNGPLIVPDAAELSSAAGGKSIQKTQTAIVMDRACGGNSMRKEEACTLPEKLNEGECVENVQSKDDILCLDKIVEAPGMDPLEKMVDEAKFHASQPRKGRLRSGTINFGMVPVADSLNILQVKKKKERQVVDKPSVVSPGSRRKQNKSAGEVRRSSRNKQLFAESEEDSTARQKGKDNQQGQDARVQMEKSAAVELTEMKPDEDFRATQDDFFVPASKKCKAKKKLELTAAVATDHQEVRKNEVSSLRAKRPSEDTHAHLVRGLVSINAKQPSKDEDFFKPASKKQKHIVSKVAKIQNPDDVLNSGTSTNAGNGDGNSDFHFDLRMEAKLAAEENAQLCAGKPTHPFFVQHKTGHQSFNSFGMAIEGGFSHQASTFAEVEELVPSAPFHVTQNSKMEACELALQSWNFAEIVGTGKAEKSPLKGGCSGSPPKELRSLLRLHAPNKPFEALREERPHGPLTDNAFQPLLNFLEEHGGKSNVHERLTTSNSEPILSLAHLENRGCSLDPPIPVSSGIREYNFAKNALWTDVHQPQLPEEVCGNKETVRSLNAWLQSWQSKCTSLMSSLEGKKIKRKTDSTENCDDDRGWFQEDSDFDDSVTEDDAQQNVLFLAGPVGCGKTAAIYACARAQGYTVIEVNSSDNRSGALIKQKFGEAMESHHLAKWSADTSSLNTALTSTKEKVSANFCLQQTGGTKVPWADKNLKPSSVASKRDAIAATENKRNKRGHTRLSSDTEEVCSQAILEGGNHLSMECENKATAVMLFEDVDMIFEEDRGFMTALTQLAETTKRPIILTSNDQEIVLPHTLGTHFLGFKSPSTRELVALACSVCVAEGIPCSPEFLEQLVKVCHHDIRKLLNFLQFWCQGHCRKRLPRAANDSKVFKDKMESGMQNKFGFQEVDTTAVTWLFDFEAQHRLWPVLIPLGFPCSAAELIAFKLSTTILETEQRLCYAEEEKIELEDAQNAILASKVKKQRKYNSPAKSMDEDTDEREVDTEETNFSQPCLSDDADESLLTPVKSLKEAKTLARSPVLRRIIKRRLAIIMSDSDEDAQNASQMAKQHQDPINTDNKNLSEKYLEEEIPNKSLNTGALIQNDLCVTGALAESEYTKLSLSEELNARCKSSNAGEVGDAIIDCQVPESNDTQEVNYALLVKGNDSECVSIETSKLSCHVALCGQESCNDLIINDAGETSKEVHKVDLSKENTSAHGPFAQICAPSKNASFESIEVECANVSNGCTEPCECTLQRACLGISSKEEGDMELLHACLEVKNALNSVKVSSCPPKNMLNCSDEFQKNIFHVPLESACGNSLSDHPLGKPTCCHEISASKSTSLREDCQLKLCKTVGLEVGDAKVPVNPGSLLVEIEESMAGTQKTACTKQSQPSHCSGPSGLGDSLNCIDIGTEVMVHHNFGQLEGLVSSCNSDPLQDVTGHFGSVSTHAHEKPSDCDKSANYCLQSTPKEDKDKIFFTEACLDGDAFLPSVEVCVDKLRETVDCLTGSRKNPSSGAHVQLPQKSSVSGGGLTNSVAVETEGVECHHCTQPHCSHLSSNSEAPQLGRTCHCAFLGHPSEKAGEDHGHVGNECLHSVSEAVRSLWSHLRNSREEYGLVPNAASRNSLSVAESLSNLAESLSACDIITSMHGSKVFEENAGVYAYVQKSDGEGCLQTCAQIAHIALHLCLQECSSLTKLLEEISPEDMMLKLNDPCTLGKLATCEGWLQSADSLHSEIGPSSVEHDLRRSERKSAVQHALSSGLPARAQGALLGAAFHEYTGFVARIGHLEQARLASGFSRRRCRGFQHYFSAHPWHLSEDSITILQQLCNFDRH